MRKRTISIPNNKNFEIFILSIVLLITILFWNSIIIFPIKLLVIFLHEISHALAVIFTGGNVISFDIFLDLSGGVVSENGNEFFIASAGYLGSLIFGLLIFISPNGKLRVIIPTILSALIILFTANFLKDGITIAYLFGFAVLFFVSPKYFNKQLNNWIMKIIGLIASIYIVLDIKEDLLTLVYRETDTQKLEMITNVPAIFWGLLWFVITIGGISFTLWWNYKKS